MFCPLHFSSVNNQNNQIYKCKTFKKIVERRHGEPIKFLFLPKMGLLGSQAGNEKKMLVVNYEQHLRVRNKRLLDKKVKFLLKNWEVVFGGLKIVFFQGQLFWFHSKGCLTATPSFSLLENFAKKRNIKYCILVQIICDTQ